ncbi:MAG: hypothetical protein E6K35_10395 [Gammaproteobacteria bacterium]|nr:MAG: hypothetical protein E6K47_10920 [Gammaproteobacteria bacterium]TLY85916.1 MAG: hypothetical protein E6K35_10395 [Gammaproteobacteria bacterium]
MKVKAGDAFFIAAGAVQGQEGRSGNVENLGDLLCRERQAACHDGQVKDQNIVAHQKQLITL